MPKVAPIAPNLCAVAPLGAQAVRGHCVPPKNKSPPVVFGRNVAKATTGGAHCAERGALGRPTCAPWRPWAPKWRADAAFLRKTRAPLLFLGGTWPRRPKARLTAPSAACFDAQTNACGRPPLHPQAMHGHFFLPENKGAVLSCRRATRGRVHCAARCALGRPTSCAVAPWCARVRRHCAPPKNESLLVVFARSVAEATADGAHCAERGALERLTCAPWGPWAPERCADVAFLRKTRAPLLCLGGTWLRWSEACMSAPNVALLDAQPSLFAVALLGAQVAR